MRIVYMGTPDFAVLPLKKLIGNGHEVVGVFTQPDKPQGRKMKLTPPPVKTVALENGIEVFQPDTFKNECMLETLKSLNPELIVVVAYGKLLPEYVLNLPKYGCINVHGSLLPKYRGAAPIQWSVINGDQYAGVTTMLMAKGLDTGDMLLKAQTEILENETSGELYERLSVMGANLLLETIDKIDEIVPEKQDDNLSCYASMLDKEIAIIDWSKKASEVHNLIRGLNPWPIAISFINGEKIKIYKSEKTTETSSKAAGTVVKSDAKNGLFVACGDGQILKLIEIQASGSKRMNACDYLRGHGIETGIILGE